MIMGPDNKTYIVHQGDKLLDGTIRTITPQGLVVVQEVNDPLSLVKQREVRKLLRSLEAPRNDCYEGPALSHCGCCRRARVASGPAAGTSTVRLKTISARVNGQRRVARHRSLGAGGVRADAPRRADGAGRFPQRVLRRRRQQRRRDPEERHHQGERRERPSRSARRRRACGSRSRSRLRTAPAAIATPSSSTSTSRPRRRRRMSSRRPVGERRREGPHARRDGRASRDGGHDRRSDCRRRRRRRTVGGVSPPRCGIRACVGHTLLRAPRRDAAGQGCESSRGRGSTGAAQTPQPPTPPPATTTIDQPGRPGKQNHHRAPDQPPISRARTCAPCCARSLKSAASTS